MTMMSLLLISSVTDPNAHVLLTLHLLTRLLHRMGGYRFLMGVHKHRYFGGTAHRRSRRLFQEFRQGGYGEETVDGLLQELERDMKETSITIPSHR